MSNVTPMLAWPRRSLTIFAGTPAKSKRLALVCRRSWTRIFRRPAAFTIAVNDRLTLLGLIGVPFEAQTIKSCSCQVSLAACCWNRCRSRCSRSTAIVAAVR